MELDRSLLKEFAQITNDIPDIAKDEYLRGTVKVLDSGKFVQLDGSSNLTPISETVDVDENDRVLVSIQNHKATIIGNFTFPPSARKEQDALDQAGNAQDTANTANTKANAAQQKAQEASDKADDAISQSSIASASAQEAKDNAQQAIESSHNASTKADEAKVLADKAVLDSTEAKKQAADSQASSQAAQTEVVKIQNEVDTVKDSVTGALTELDEQADAINGLTSKMELEYSTKTETAKVRTDLSSEITQKVGELESNVTKNYAAKTDVVAIEGKLQTQISQNADSLALQSGKVEKIEADTAQAQKDVADAISKATTAQTVAGEAQSKALEAQTAADTASTNANTAIEKAQLSENAATAATIAANNADKKVQAAQTDLAEAKKNLETVVSDVNATKEDVANAQAKVNTAQKAADSALADAAEARQAATNAQSAADKAQTDAATAQTEATNAKNKADNAKMAADAAKAAADKANADVAALTKRVTKSEADIKINSEGIELQATRIEEIGTDLDNNYYTKTEAEAKISLASNSVITTVKNQYTAKGEAIKTTQEQFYISTSPTALSGGSWSANKPTFQQGKYIWRRTLNTRADNTTYYSPDDKGVCITGNTGAQGVQGLQGPKGDQGIQGPTGAAGKNSYFHIKYSSVSKPTTSAQMTETPDTYIGTYVDFIEADSTDPSKYTWSRFEGAQGAKGEQGIAGKNGANGQTSYLHIAYATNGTGTSGFSVSDSVGKTYIGQYTDFNANDSTDPSKYIWTLIKGETGAQGPAGKGIKLTTITYQVGTNATTAPTGTWSSTIPAVSQGQYLWNRVIITYTDNTTSTSYSVSYIPTNGINGTTGTGVNTIAQQYYLSTSKTAQTGGSWVTAMPVWSVGKYLWTRYAITYKNPTATAYTAPICDSSWEAVNEVQVGAKNLLLNSDETVTNSSYPIKTYTMSEKMVANETYTCRLWGTLGTGKSYFGLWLDGGSISLGSLANKGNGVFELTFKGKAGTLDPSVLHVYPVASSVSVNSTITRIKLEKGNKATDWSQAPEDINTNIENVESNLNERIDGVNTAISTAQATITQLADQIAHLVVDENGGSMMTQTSNGWQFNMSAINNNFNTIQESIGKIEKSQGSDATAINGLKDQINGLNNKTSYIIMAKDSAGTPYIELGNPDSKFKVRITNTSIDFMEGSNVIAYANNNTFYVGKMIVEKELQIGLGPGIVWRPRANGNVGLVYISK